MISRLAEIASREVGYKETEGSNLGPAVKKYQYATDLEPGSWPWCSAFVCWCLMVWLRDPNAKEWLALKRRSPEDWRPKTALAYGFLEWAKSRPNTVDIFPDSIIPAPGDIVTFDFSHVGIVANANADTITTIEGNTNSAGSREGDGVWIKTRQKNIARNFLRVHSSLSVG